MNACSRLAPANECAEIMDPVSAFSGVARSVYNEEATAGMTPGKGHPSYLGKVEKGGLYLKRKGKVRNQRDGMQVDQRQGCIVSLVPKKWRGRLYPKRKGKGNTKAEAACR